MKIFNRQVPFTKSDAAVQVMTPTAHVSTANYRPSDYRSGGAKWQGGLSESNSPMVYDHWRLRQNGRKAYQDSVHAHGLVTRFADSIADTGLKLDSNPLFDLLGITPEKAETWARDVEERFHLWSKNKKQNRSERQTFYQSHNFYQKNKKRDGECFVRLFYSKDKSLQNPLQFEFIDPNQIRGDAYTSTSGPYATQDGIDRDDRGREKNYKIWNSKIVDNQIKFTYETIPRVGEKSKKIFMLHCFEPEYPGQGRGFSELSHFLQEFQQLTDFKLAHIQKAINESNIFASIQNKQQDPSNPTANLSLEPPGAAGLGVKSGSPESNSGPITDGERYAVNVCQPNEINMKTPGSTAFMNTKMGDEIKFHQNTAPSNSYESFQDAFLGSLVSSIGMPLSVHKMKMDSSFSAARGELLLFWQSINIGRENQSSDYLNPMFEMWISEEIASGNISAPGFNDPVLKAAWLNCTWVGGAMPNIDPEKTAKGLMKYLTMNATTIDRVSREYNGSDAKGNMMKNNKTFPEMTMPAWQKNENAVVSTDSGGLE